MYQQHNVFVASAFLVLTSQLLAVTGIERFGDAIGEASVTYDAFLNMFETCLTLDVPSQQFKIDNLKGFINYPSKTTVGSAPKVTSNRKFFANVVTTREFKNMLENDIDTIRGNYVKKMNFCANATLNPETVKDFYDREVDQTKM